MKLGIMQPYFLPYIGYWQLMKTVDTYVIYDDVNYIKGGWINRNQLLLNGKAFLFNLILNGASPNKLINEISVADNQEKLLKTIHSAYAKAPLFTTIFPLIEQMIRYENKNLGRYLGNSLVQIANYLQLDTKFIYSSDIKEKNNTLKAQDKVIHICTILGATEYYNAIGGMDLYNKADFERNKIQLHFVKANAIVYKQLKNVFVPNLSILDVLMFNSADEVNAMLDNYELI
ncbi:MAG: WbqC family protein [Culturomica sp.]|jgi:hypothetical protein|nr:WbqC family protein [Culturomica sp.]